MKRRQFIKGVGAGSAGFVAAPALASHVRGQDRLPPFDYGKAERMAEVISQEGLVVLRLAIEGASLPKTGFLKEQIQVRKARLARSRGYFFESDERFDAESLELMASSPGSDQEVVVLWLDQASEESQISLGGKKAFSFKLAELLSAGELSGEVGGHLVKAHFLLDRELGEVDLQAFGASDPGNNFSFLAMADPQGGDPEGGNPQNPDFLRTRMKIHNAFIQESVDLANRVEVDPLFTMVIGDVCDDWGYEKDLLQMNAFLSRIKGPVLYGIGNHETELRSSFGPGYNMKAFSNYLAAQQALNGLKKLAYSFNAGRWHFVVWPDPLRRNFWETHPHYFDWLERDLEKHRDRPTLVFQHVPSHPIGITPHINYAESVYVRRTFLDILARHGNVKCVLSGHVHIPVKAAMKTAVEYRGMRMINLPAAGYRPRNFGEEDYYGGPSQGLALVHIREEELSIQFKTVTEEVFDFPQKLPAFDEKAYPLWLKEKWELPASEGLINGDFSKGLEAWARRYVYMEDEDPANICELRPAPGIEGKALYLWNRRRGYQAPGQDRLPQDVNRLCQAIALKASSRPTLEMHYRIDGEHTAPDGFSGAYMLAEGYRGSHCLLRLRYSAGKVWVNNWGVRNWNEAVRLHHFDLPFETDTWMDGQLNLASDYEQREGKGTYDKLKLDRLVLSLGVWNINDGEPWPFGIYFSQLAILPQGKGPSMVAGKAVEEKQEAQIWWRNKLWPNVNMAGEHRYVIATRPEGTIPR